MAARRCPIGPLGTRQWSVALRSPLPGTNTPPPTRAGAIAAIALIPVLLAVAYVEVVASVADSLSDIHAKAHHPTGALWLGGFALLGVAGPAAAAVAAFHTRAEGRSVTQAALRAEMAFVMIGIPAMFLLLIA